MAGPEAHLSMPELADRFTACRDSRTARQIQAIGLLAEGHSFAEAAAATAFGERWVRRLSDQTDVISSRMSFHWRPETAKPKHKLN